MCIALKNLCFRDSGTPYFARYDVDSFPNLFTRSGLNGEPFLGIRRSGITIEEAKLMVALKAKSDRLSDFFNKLDYIVFHETEKVDLELLRMLFDPLNIKICSFGCVKSGIIFSQIFSFFPNLENISVTFDIHDDSSRLSFRPFCNSFEFLRCIKRLSFSINTSSAYLIDYLAFLSLMFRSSPTLRELNVTGRNDSTPEWDQVCNRHIGTVMKQKKQTKDFVKNICIVLLSIKKFKVTKSLQFLCKDVNILLSKFIIQSCYDLSTWGFLTWRDF